MTDTDYSVPCPIKSPRAGNPCRYWAGHDTEERAYPIEHSFVSPSNEERPRLKQFREIVEEGLDRGVQYSYLDIARRMNHPNLTSVARYGLGSPYTKLRQKIYAERGIKPLAGGSKERVLWRQQEIVRELREAGRF